MRTAVSRTGAERLGFAAAVTSWIGAGLTLPYYGAEDFALHAIGKAAAAGDDIDVVALTETFRFGPVAATTFAIGLLALGAGAVLAAVAIWRSGVLPRYSGIPYAAGFVLFIPQFYPSGGTDQPRRPTRRRAGLARVGAVAGRQPG